MQEKANCIICNNEAIHSNYTKTYSNRVFVSIELSGYMLDTFIKAIKTACEEFDLEAFVVGPKAYKTDIANDIINGIKESRFIILDYSFWNQRAYWETEIARGLKSKVICSARSDWFEKNRSGHILYPKDIILWTSQADLSGQLMTRIRDIVEDETYD